MVPKGVCNMSDSKTAVERLGIFTLLLIVAPFNLLASWAAGAIYGYVQAQKT